ncbi:MAG: NACHT domain-containing protein [Actinomycetota bacterium]|nr:NACHT domain-containing protein [Actinomycetota bacterium]
MLRTEVLAVGLQMFAVVVGVAGVLSFVLAAANYAHDPDKSLRHIVGWTVAVFGVLTTCGALGWWASQGLSATHGVGLVLVSVAATGVFLACAGAVVAMRTPVSDLPQLRAIADAVEEHIHQLDANDSFDRNRYVAMSVQPRAGARVRRVGVTRLLRWPTVRLTVICGGRGSGKSASLRQIALDVCEQVKRRRRPQQMVVYVDLRALAAAATDTLTVEMIREHLRASVRAHDGAAAEFLEQHLERARGLRWLFIFDSIDELGVAERQPASGDSDCEPRRSAAEKCLHLIEQLTRNRRDFRAVVAMRENPATRAFTGSVLTMADLSVRQQRALLRPFSITSTTHRSLFDRLAHDAAVKDLAVNPLLLSMLGAHLRANRAIELKRTRYEIFEGIIGSRLQTALDPKGVMSESEVRRAAERIAYRMFAERIGVATSATQTPGVSAMDTMVPTVKDAALQALVRARLGWQDRSGFQFCHQAVQVHFAATYLLSEETRAEARELITSEAWSDVLISALQAGPTKFRDVITAAATDVLLAEVAALRDLVPDVQTYLGRDEQPPILPGSFYWPPVTLHALEVLRNGLRFEPALSPERLPVAMVEATDQLILTAVVAGGLAAKKDAVDQLPVASPEVGVWVAKRALDWTNDELAGRVIQQLAVMPGVFRELGVGAQCFAVAGALANKLVGPVLSRRSVTDEDAGTLPGVLYNVIRVGQAFAPALGLWMIIQFAAAYPTFSFWLVFTVVLALVAAAVFLYDSGVPAVRGLTNIGYLGGGVLVIFAAVAALLGVFSALDSVIALLTLDVGEAANEALFAYLSLWPLAMTVYVVVDSPTTRINRFQEWLLPHVRLARMIVAWLQEKDWLQEKEVRAAIRGAVVWRQIAVVVFLSLLLVIALIDLPGVNRETEETVGGILVLVALFFLFGFDRKLAGTLRQLNWWKVKRLPNEAVDNVELLRLLVEWSSRSRNDTSRLLEVFANAEPGSLRNAVPALTDLDNALEFVRQMVPADTTTQIPGALWALGPHFTLPDFRAWLIKYDERYPGRLTWLASSRRDLLAQVLHRAKERADIGETMVFRSLSHSSEPEKL